MTDFFMSFLFVQRYGFLLNYSNNFKTFLPAAVGADSLYQVGNSLGVVARGNGNSGNSNTVQTESAMAALAIKVRVQVIVMVMVAAVAELVANGIPVFDGMDEMMLFEKAERPEND